MTPVNSNVRYPTMSTLKRKAELLNYASFEHAEDARGLYFTAVQLNPKWQAHFDRLDAKRRDNPVVARATLARSGPVRPVNEEGPVAIVRRYVAANPGVDRGTAIAALVAMGINKATASIQYKKATS